MSTFEHVRDEFLQSLPPTERQLFIPFASSEQLLEEVRQWDVIQKENFRAARLLSNIKEFSDNIQPYFDAIGFLVSSHPEFTALAWGGIRLVLKISSNFSSFFEKLTDVLKRLSLELTVYEQFVKLQDTSLSPRLENALRTIYGDLFVFLSTIVRIFSKKKGAAKNRFFVSGKLCWKPFDSFDDILQKFHMHADLFKDEVLLEQLRLSSSVEQAFQQERIKAVEDRLAIRDASSKAKDFQDATADSLRSLEKVAEAESLLRVQQWISPPDFASEFEKLLYMRAEGTSEWLSKNRQFRSWSGGQGKEALGRKKFGSNTLWIRGNPGCGKTILAAATVETLQQGHAYSHHNAPKVYYYFFRYGSLGLSTSISAYSALLAQILQQHKNDHDLIDKFIFMMQENYHGQLQASRGNLTELLRLCLHWLGNTMVVLDGIDECEDANRLIADLVIQSAVPGVKVAVFSRPTIRVLLECVPESQQLSIGRSTARDIEVYLKRSLSDFVGQGFLPQGSDVNKLASQLTSAADGMFLWAHLMVKYLSSYALTPQKRHKTIIKILHPEGLEAMYNRIADLIYHSLSAERILAKRAIAWLSHCRRVMSSTELQGALNVHEGDGSDQTDATPEQQILLERALLTSCAGLIEREVIYSHFHKSDIVAFRFMHRSVMEFFNEGVPLSDPGPEIRSAGSKYLTCKASDTHVQIAWTCLRYLTYFVPAQPLSGVIGARAKPNDLCTGFAFIRYAALNWVQHLEATIKSFEGQAGELEAITESYPMLPTLAAFLYQKLILMAWIEATYTFGEVPPYETLRHWSQSLLALCEYPKDLRSNSKALLKDSLEFSGYLESLDRYWTRHLMSSPECLWQEVTAFTPSRFLLEISSAIVEPVVCVPPREGGLSTTWLNRISETSSTGTSMFVLTIWPSRLYQIAAMKEKPLYAQSMSRLCSDWIAYYEMFSVAQDGKTTLCHCLSIPLAAKEIETQIRQSLWFEPKTDPNFFNWKMQFPTAIAPDGGTFSILRTIYRLRTLEFTKVWSYDAVVLPFESSIVLASAWARYNVNTNCGTGERPKMASFASWQAKLGIHVYWITFSDDGKLIFYSDHSLGAPVNIALFGMTKRKKLEVILHNETCLDLYYGPGTEDIRGLRIAFHHDSPVVAFTFLEDVYLWTFGVGGPYYNPKIICRLGKVCDLKFSHEGGSLVLFHSNIDQPIILQLPRDAQSFDRPIPGEYKTLLTSHSDFTQIQRPFLPLCMTEAEFKEDPSVPSDSHEYQWLTTRDPNHGATCSDVTKDGETSSTRREILKSYPTTLIRGMYSSTPCDGMDVGWMSNVSDGSLDLRAWTASAGAYASNNLELSKLPDWPGLATATFSVKLPQRDNPLVNVFINKHADQWSDMSTPVDEHCPAILVRPADEVSKRLYPFPTSSNKGWRTQELIMPKNPMTSTTMCFDFKFESGHHYVYLKGGTRVVKTLFPLSRTQVSMDRKYRNAFWLACGFAYEKPRARRWSKLLDTHHRTWSHLAQTQLTSNGARNHIEVTVVRQFGLVPAYLLTRLFTVPADAGVPHALSALTWILDYAIIKLEVRSADSASTWSLSRRWDCIHDDQTLRWL